MHLGRKFWIGYLAACIVAQAVQWLYSLAPIPEVATMSFHSYHGRKKRHARLNNPGDGTSFVEHLISCNDINDFQDLRMTVGESWTIRNPTQLIQPFQDCHVTHIHFLGRPMSTESLSTTDSAARTQTDPAWRTTRMKELFLAFDHVSSVDELNKLRNQAQDLGLFDHVSDTKSATQTMQVTVIPPKFCEYSHTVLYPVLLTVRVPTSAMSIVRSDESVLALQATLRYTNRYKQSPPDLFPGPVDQNRIFHAPILSRTEESYTVRLFINLLGCASSLDNFISVEKPIIQDLVLNSMWEKHMSRQSVEGVVVTDDFLTKNFQNTLNGYVDALAGKQEQQNMVDYHPHSNKIVRDLVHPAIYSYVKGMSPLRASIDEMSPCEFPMDIEAQVNKLSQDIHKISHDRHGEQNLDQITDGSDSSDQRSRLHKAGDETLQDSTEANLMDIESKSNVQAQRILQVSTGAKDFWGRPYEDSVYQWLPTYFNISDDGHCTIEDYINNLVPRDLPVHRDLYNGLATLFEQSLPYIETVYSHVQAVSPQVRMGDLDNDWLLNPDTSYSRELNMRNVSLRGQALQVITKIVDYELKAGQSYDGVWHVEGMSHEDIVLTCLYVLDRNETIIGGEIEYKRAFLEFEARYLYWNIAQARPPMMNKIAADGLVPMGHLATSKGRLIVFPNSHVHRVRRMVNNLTDGSSLNPSARRRIVVFFLVNPLKRIVSTREVAPQQDYAGGTMTHEDAFMQERKFRKQDWNVRPIELCEH